MVEYGKMSDPKQFPHTGKKQREILKREGENSGKAGRVQGKGGAPTSHKATGGKNAR